MEVAATRLPLMLIQALLENGVTTQEGGGIGMYKAIYRYRRKVHTTSTDIRKRRVGSDEGTTCLLLRPHYPGHFYLHCLLQLS